ncbi:sensor histidine kinase [Pseudooceanicola nitratireducens]|uniref:sensor histidine kinase n=1 Tax=Pseudooceanicola nitratireducens TaxID=517719 RepID=UPI0023F1A053|nr:histidine kinase dimerization/phosphoacceptor domain -containing protein [Pseudooceanicola nitratireducens]
MIARTPSDQKDRLKDLQDLNILDTDPEEKFDDVVNLASKICGMPISLISLVSDDRQWFKSSVGMEAAETPIEQAICAHAILEDDFLEIRDTRTDPRTADNPLVTGDENLRFYAGAVLRSRRGNPVGTLCVLDNKPNALNALQRETLRVLARQVMSQMELRRALKEAELLRQEVDHRVKNSLQSVSALTRMQARSVTSPEAREALDLTRRRIETVALLHQQLYAAHNAGRVDMRAFLPRVAQLLQGSMPDHIRIETQVDDLWLSATRAAAVGVIINEFAANVAKHAYPDGRQGRVTLALTALGEDRVQLICKDDGVGMPDKAPAASGLGLRIIEASAQQLGGHAEMKGGPGGTSITIEMPVEIKLDEGD